MPLTILDTKGLELEDYLTIKDGIINEVRQRRGEDPDRYVHLAWLCISEDSKRIEDAELELARSLKALGVEVIVVVTKATRFKENVFRREIEAQFRGICTEVCLTHAVKEPIFGDDDEVIGHRGVRGIDELISISYRYIPESQRQSFANVLSIKHRQSLEVKQREAERVVAVASGAAAAAAATPLPFSDALTLVPIQIVMIIKVSHSFGIDVTESAVLPALGALLGSGVATLIGRTLVSSILKFIPGIGSLAGGLISGAIAQQLTARLGSLYIAILRELAESNQPLEFESAISLLKQKLEL